MSLSGGGLVERPSDARDGLERLAAICERTRVPLLLGGAAEEVADVSAEAEVELARLGASRAMLVPVEDGGRIAAVAVMLWHEGDEAPRPEIAEALSAALSEALAIQRRAHPGLLRRAGNWLTGTAISVFGRAAWKLKLAVAIIAAALVAAAVLPSDYRPSFQARIEATERRVVSAPFDGVLAQADIESGDVVEAGALLLAMEDADLRLELARMQARLQSIEAELQTARARRDTAQVRLLEAEAAQAATELRLVERRLDQARVTAERPVIVVGGDARRRVGGRVRLGEPLLEVAAPDSVRLLAFLDEDWVAEMSPGQAGAALLAAYPDRPVPATLVHIGTDAEDREGVNVFPAWFDVAPAGDMRVLDGMRGVVRVEVGETSVLAARTRGLRRWAERTAWRLGLTGVGG
jgi:multidrug resistance efflux pump